MPPQPQQQEMTSRKMQLDRVSAAAWIRAIQPTVLILQPVGYDSRSLVFVKDDPQEVQTLVLLGWQVSHS